ncbi:MAG: helix-turn-helix transcriptional regulator [Roseicyclus sp.]|nr:helix-turn-helix transcriptional regulator [Roseicyclus sp.]MBO6923579.1 helix-turn-helix transcriptional regulator [Roseicyclus sp.]
MAEVPYCPMEVANRVFGGKWKPGILFRLAKRSYRFGELKRDMPWISERVLIRQLKELVEDGIVHREDHRQVPPRVEYSITEHGRTLAPLLKSMADWGDLHVEATTRRTG